MITFSPFSSAFLQSYSTVLLNSSLKPLSHEESGMAARQIFQAIRRMSSSPVAETLLEPAPQQPSRIRAVYASIVLSVFKYQPLRFFGFLTGVTTACGAGYVYLTEDINESSREVQRSVASLSRDVAQARRVISPLVCLIVSRSPRRWAGWMSSSAASVS